MARTSSLITIELRHLVFYFLDHYLSSNALFFASQLHAHDPSSADTSHLLSLCYFRMNQLSAGAQASEYFARNGRHIGCAYVYAQCCLGLRRFKDGFEALESCRPAWSSADAWGNYWPRWRQKLVYNWFWRTYRKALRKAPANSSGCCSDSMSIGQVVLREQRYSSCNWGLQCGTQVASIYVGRFCWSMRNRFLNHTPMS